jgi:hypothetical protein
MMTAGKFSAVRSFWRHGLIVQPGDIVESDNSTEAADLLATGCVTPADPGTAARIQRADVITWERPAPGSAVRWMPLVE